MRSAAVFVLLGFVTALRAQCPVPILQSLNDGLPVEAGSQVEVIWDNPDFLGMLSPPDSYLYYSLDSGATWEFIENYIDTNFTVTYTWNVPQVSTDSALFRVMKFSWGCWDQSELMFGIEATTSDNFIGFASTSIRFVIYPNPVSTGQDITLSFDGCTPSDQIDVYSLVGTHVFTATFSDPTHSVLKIPSYRLLPGRYIVTVKSLNYFASQKLVVLD